MKRIFLILTLFILFAGLTQAQWWFNGQNIYWPKGDVSVTKGDFSVTMGYSELSLKFDSRTVIPDNEALGVDTLKLGTTSYDNIVLVRDTTNAEDSVHAITGGISGTYYQFQAKHTDTTIVFIDGGNLELNATRTLDDDADILYCYYDGTSFIEISFTDVNGTAPLVGASLAVSANATIGGTLEVTGIITALSDVNVTGDIGVGGALNLDSETAVIYSTGGAPMAGTDGSSQACDDGDRHIVEVMIPYTVSITGVGYLVGATGGTDSVVVELFDNAGDLVAGCTSVVGDTASGDIVGTAAQFHKVPFTDGAVEVNAGIYYISVQFDGTTATYAAYTVTGSAFIGLTEAGTAWTPASITPGTTFTVDEAPISFIY